MAFRRPPVAGMACCTDRAIADQFADIGDRPIGAGFDEPVGILLGDVILNRIDLFADHAQQRVQGIALCGVAGAVEHRQQIIEAVRGHGLIS